MYVFLQFDNSILGVYDDIDDLAEGVFKVGQKNPDSTFEFYRVVERELNETMYI